MTEYKKGETSLPDMPSAIEHQLRRVRDSVPDAKWLPRNGPRQLTLPYVHVLVFLIGDRCLWVSRAIITRPEYSEKERTRDCLSEESARELNNPYRMTLSILYTPEYFQLIPDSRENTSEREALEAHMATWKAGTPIKDLFPALYAPPAIKVVRTDIEIAVSLRDYLGAGADKRAEIDLDALLTEAKEALERHSFLSIEGAASVLSADAPFLAVGGGDGGELAKPLTNSGVVGLAGMGFEIAPPTTFVIGADGKVKENK